ncbi:glyoxalase [Picosynechococcus sp. PCC 7003]|uniref:VOC family protein n=1 Tax=Picosynechococcus sp. PCC 7003 TaxID=374981 RepID=UPI000810D995|nr:VOC family protein [Picosynechococcus sp. PCC 7003]ANV84636.1 glyoxalase [Picosynechococcus sp. PCC 7003]
MKLGFVIIYVDDVKKTLQFYKEAFGIKIRMEHEDNGIVLYGEMETEGAILGFASPEMGQLNLGGKYQKITPEKDPVGQEIVFVNDNVNAVYNQAVKAGANSISAPVEKPWGQTVAYVRSIEGTLIEICSPMNA